MEKYMLVSKLSEYSGVGRSSIHKRLRREKADTVDVPVANASGGTQMAKAVPMAYAKAFIDRVAQAKRSAETGIVDAE